MKSIKVFLFALFALIFLVLGFLVSWWFIIGSVVLVIINQRELMKSEKIKMNKK